MIAQCLALAVVALNCAITYLTQAQPFGDKIFNTTIYSNVQQVQRHTSLLTPHKFAFTANALVSSLDLLAMLYLITNRNRQNHNFDKCSKIWIAANILQTVQMLIFAIDQITLSAVAIVPMVACLALMLYTFIPSVQEKADYMLLLVPLLIHTGWNTVLAFVNLNMLVLSLSANFQYGVAFVTLVLWLMIGMFIPIQFHGKLTLPMNVAFVWAFIAIHKNMQGAIAGSPGAFVPACLKTLSPQFAQNFMGAAIAGALFMSLVSFMMAITPMRKNSPPRACEFEGEKYFAHA